MSTITAEPRVVRGFWIDAGSYARNQYDKHRLRTGRPQPRNWRDDKAALERAVLKLYPDAGQFHYKGGVLRFRWNNGEGSGTAYESGMTNLGQPVLEV